MATFALNTPKVDPNNYETDYEVVKDGKVKLKWLSIDLTSMTPEMAELYKQQAEIADTLSNVRKALEELIVSASDIPDGREMVFGYNYAETLGVAFPKAKAKGAGKVSLAAFAKKPVPTTHKGK